MRKRHRVRTPFIVLLAIAIASMLFSACKNTDGQTNVVTSEATARHQKTQGEYTIDMIRVRRSSDLKKAEVLWHTNKLLAEDAQTRIGFGRCAILARNEFEQGIRWNVVGELVNAEQRQYMGSLDYDLMVRDYLAVPGGRACARVWIQVGNETVAISPVQSVPIPDVHAPRFHGLVEAKKTGQGTVELMWKRAHDVSRPVRYRIYENPKTACENLEKPIETLGASNGKRGELSYAYRPAGTAATISFLVRAVDRMDNEDDNCVIQTVEL